jgi:hypothetical protein
MVHRMTVVLGILVSLVGNPHAQAEDSPPQPTRGANAARETVAPDFDPGYQMVFRVEGLRCPAVSGLG